MRLKSLTFCNLSIGSFNGTMGFIPEFVDEPSTEPAKLLCQEIRKILRIGPYFASVLWTDSSEMDVSPILLKVKAELPDLFHLVENTSGRLGKVSFYADRIFIRCKDWIGLPGHELILTYQDGRDPTNGLPNSFYQYYWIEKGDATPQQLVSFCLQYPKWRVHVPPRSIFSTTVNF
jgi:hypothetical protein